MNIDSKHIIAPELYGNFWLNSQPVSLYSHRGEVFLINFWDYTNFNCIKTLPYILEWQNKYKEFGLVVVGVHTPEFEFARSSERVQKAIEHFNITYPVMLDNDGIIWNAYGAHEWPTSILIDRDGYVRFIHFGEGGFIEFERAMQQLLIEAGCHGDLPPLSSFLSDEDQAEAVRYRQTNELYFGYLRGALGNPEGYNPESTIEYKDTGIYIPERFYAVGKWLNEKQCLRFNGNAGEDGAILVPYNGCNVNAVMGSKDGSLCKIMLHLDSQILSKEIYGEDIKQLSNNVSSILVDTPRMYQLVRNKEYGSHILKLSTVSPNLEIYSFTFTTSAIPELISTN